MKGIQMNVEAQRVRVYSELCLRWTLLGVAPAVCVREFSYRGTREYQVGQARQPCLPYGSVSLERVDCIPILHSRFRQITLPTLLCAMSELHLESTPEFVVHNNCNVSLLHATLFLIGCTTISHFLSSCLPIRASLREPTLVSNVVRLNHCKGTTPLQSIICTSVHIKNASNLGQPFQVGNRFRDLG